jgi:hypothetical protein
MSPMGSLLPIDVKKAIADAQREEPVKAWGCTHGESLQADVQRGGRRCPERQLYEVKLTQ